MQHCFSIENNFRFACDLWEKPQVYAPQIVLTFNPSAAMVIVIKKIPVRRVNIEKVDKEILIRQYFVDVRFFVGSI